jgi:2-dehydropantoate 2-reductase
MDPTILFYGAGAIGCTLYAWLKPFNRNILLLARGKTAQKIRSEGISLYVDDKQKTDTLTNIKLIESIDDLEEEPNIIVITVKNYSLNDVCETIKKKFPSSNSIIVTLQNGLENLKICPKYFSRVIYGVICYNAWRDSPNMIGYKERGPIILGTPKNTLKKELEYVHSIFHQGFPCEITSRYVDAAHNKILLNLSNSFFTLIGVGFQKISSLNKFRILTTSISYEGLKILKKAGIEEVKLGALPSWRLIRTAATLPGFITNPIFRKTIEKSSGINSMAQDLLINKNSDTEIETLNGYLIALAEKVGFDPKINKKLYEICKREFSKDDFQPLDIESVWDEFQDVL